MATQQTGALAELIDFCDGLVSAMENEGMRGVGYDRERFAAIAHAVTADVDRLRAALVEERARRDYCEFPAEPGWDLGTESRHERQREMWRRIARKHLIAEGLLPPD